MPFTPFHFGPAGTVALIGKKYLYIPAFILVNIAIDIEPLLVIVFRLNYPLHGYCHTFLIGSLVGGIFAIALYSGRKLISKIINILKLAYETNFKRIFYSSLFGVWFHVFLDGFIYTDIRPFYPLSINPLYGLISKSFLYAICGIFFVPFAFLYLYQNKKKNKRDVRDG